MTDRRRLFVGGAAAAAAGAALITPTAASARALDDVLRSQELRVGVNPTLPPRALFNERNQIDGFEPELAAAIAQKLGVRLVLQAVGSPDLPITPGRWNWRGPRWLRVRTSWKTWLWRTRVGSICGLTSR